jgi:palmitoyltransferase
MNCVSYTNFPHFIRFVLYAVISMSILSYHLFTRLQALWSDRNLPAYLGPSIAHLALLFVIVLSNSLVLFFLLLLLMSAGRSLVTNTSQIESWEIERHEDLITRARKMGGYVYANGGQKMRIERQEFPYDIGFWNNLCQGMGTSNVLMWFMPFGGSPGIEGAADWEVNGFEDESKSWPPPDPDKMPRTNSILDNNVELSEYGSVEEEMAAFRKRQREDYARRDLKGSSSAGDYDEIDYESEDEEGLDGEDGWTNTDGERLQDYGVDDDEDDIPIGELLRRRKARTHD